MVGMVLLLSMVDTFCPSDKASEKAREASDSGARDMAMGSRVGRWVSAIHLVKEISLYN